MSDYTQFTFVSTQAQRDNVGKQLGKLFDAFSIKELLHYKEDLYSYRLTISELALKDSLELINKIKSKNKNLVFFVEYGVYY